MYQALTTIDGLASWWTRETAGSSNAGDSIQFTFKDDDDNEMATMVMEVKELSTNQKVSWRCTGGPEEWIGTDLVFDLSEQDDQVIVIFEHLNWQEQAEFMAHCGMKWATFLLSLRDYVETGKGQPAPDDIKIDNWN